MPPRRSLTLWLGLLGFLFILAAWVDSTRYRTNFGFQHAWGLHRHNSLDLGYPWGHSHRTSTYFERYAHRRRDQLGFARLQCERSAGRYVQVTIPHWLILLVYTQIWIVFLVWRRRRLRRAMASIPLPT